MLHALRRSVVALLAAGAVAAYLRLRNSEQTPPIEGGWRELSGSELR